jgi:hypothetical protein
MIGGGLPDRLRLFVVSDRYAGVGTDECRSRDEAPSDCGHSLQLEGALLHVREDLRLCIGRGERSLPCTLDRWSRSRLALFKPGPGGGTFIASVGGRPATK